jgi:hypothetical protein
MYKIDLTGVCIFLELLNTNLNADEKNTKYGLSFLNNSKIKPHTTVNFSKSYRHVHKQSTKLSSSGEYIRDCYVLIPDIYMFHFICLLFFKSFFTICRYNTNYPE